MRGMKETMTKLAVNFGPGEAFDVFVGREQLGKAVVVLAGRWAEVTVGAPRAAQPDPEAFREKNPLFGQACSLATYPGMGAEESANDEKHRKEFEDLLRGNGAELMDKIKIDGGEFHRGGREGRELRYKDWSVLFFSDPYEVEVKGKVCDEGLGHVINGLSVERMRECVRIALHFLKDRFVIVPMYTTTQGSVCEFNGLSIFPDRVEIFAGSLLAPSLFTALFGLIRLCEAERDKSVTGTATDDKVELFISTDPNWDCGPTPSAIVDGIDTSHGVAIGKPERTAHLHVGGKGWNVFYWEKDGVEIHGEVDWAAFERSLGRASDPGQPDAGPHVRKALMVALVECAKRGLVETSPLRCPHVLAGDGIRFYRGPSAIWMESTSDDTISMICKRMNIVSITEALLIATRMLGGAK